MIKIKISLQKTHIVKLLLFDFYSILNIPIIPMLVKYIDDKNYNSYTILFNQFFDLWD